MEFSELKVAMLQLYSKWVVRDGCNCLDKTTSLHLTACTVHFSRVSPMYWKAAGCAARGSGHARQAHSLTRGPRHSATRILSTRILTLPLCCRTVVQAAGRARAAARVRCGSRPGARAHGAADGEAAHRQREGGARQDEGAGQVPGGFFHTVAEGKTATPTSGRGRW